MKILNMGSLNIDHVYHVKTIVKPGETIASSKVEQACGGKGLNQSIALAKAGMTVCHGGMVGVDGEILIDALKSAGVSTEKVKITNGQSGHTIIQVDENAQNSIILFGGANREITEEYIDLMLQDLEEGDLVLFQNEISNLSYALDCAKEKKLQIIFNPSPMEDYLMTLDLSSVSLFFINEIEGEQLTGEKMPEKILASMSAKYPFSAVVLTYGARGAYFRKNQECYYQEAYKVQALDTTAAGDTFTGYFVKEYFETGNVKRALQLAAKASSIAVTRMGASSSIPIFEEVFI